ncbi:unnamed protein product [Brachionus calyciflorus]|uniref:Uncharacterized protein n=1 Tax=Brachionus calyciflorus TaxID=104777 RepID=A0A813P602_9BILA|nr:unnamed protein product [Brachionus calyciflorus]
MSNLANTQNIEILAIDCFFSFLTQRRHKFYENLGTTAFNFLKSSDYTQINTELLKLNNNEKITEKHISRLLFNIFTTFDPSKLGHQAVNLILDIKNFKTKIPFMIFDENSKLQNLCDEAIISSQHVNCSIFIDKTPLIVNATKQQASVPVISTSVPLNNCHTPLGENNQNSLSENQLDLTPANLNSALQNFLKEFSSKIECNNDSRDKILLKKMSLMLKEHKKQTTPSEDTQKITKLKMKSASIESIPKQNNQYQIKV